MKRIQCWICLLLAIVGLSACQGKKEGGTRMISVTIEPQRYFVEKIAGDLFQVYCVTPAGQSPETYDPTPQQMVQISQSQAYFRIGEIGFEQAWMKNLQSQNPDMRVFDLSEGMELIKNQEEEHEGEEAHHHHHGSVDPHIWTSISGAKVIAQNTCQALVKLDPENQETYQAGYQRLIGEIDSTAVEMKRLLQPLAGSAFIIYHPTLTYFAREFGLQQLCIELDGKEPSPAQLKRLIETAAQSKAKVVFVQQEFDQKNAKLIAKETGCRLVKINPLSYNWHDEMIRLATILAGKDGQAD